MGISFGFTDKARGRRIAHHTLGKERHEVSDECAKGEGTHRLRTAPATRLDELTRTLREHGQAVAARSRDRTRE